MCIHALHELPSASPTVLAVVLGLVVVSLLSATTVLRSHERAVVTVLGEQYDVLEPGLQVVPPFVSTVHRYDLRTHTLDLVVDTDVRDGADLRASLDVFVRVAEPETTFREIDEPYAAAGDLAKSAAVSVLGDLTSDDELLRDYRELEERIADELAEPLAEWGVDVVGVELEELEVGEPPHAA